MYFGKILPSRVSTYFLSPTKIKACETSIVIPQCSCNLFIAESTTMSSPRWQLLNFSFRLSNLPPDLRSPVVLLQSLYLPDFNVSSEKVIKNKYINDKRATIQQWPNQPERKRKGRLSKKRKKAYKYFPCCSIDVYKTSLASSVSAGI